MTNANADDARSVLANFSWFDLLDRRQRQLVLSTSRLHRASAKELLGRRGDHPHSWTGVLNGIVKASSYTADGRVNSFVLAYAGDWIEECDIINRSPRPYDVATLTDSTLLYLASDTFRALTRSSVEFSCFAMKALTTRHMRMVAHRHIERVSSKEACVAKVLAELIQTQGTELTLTQEDVAEIAGLTRQSVNEAINSLAQKKLIEKRYGRITVQNLAVLRSTYFSVASVS